MMQEQSLLHYFVEAGPVVRTVMVLLLSLSLLSWVAIFQRFIVLRRGLKSISSVEEKIWSASDLSRLYHQASHGRFGFNGIMHLFVEGFKSFLSHEKTSDVTKMAAISRAIRIAKAKEIEKLEKHLSLLASIGSVSPYIGLFGTVWGIMTAFAALGQVQQASIAMVAPGISEALLVTAMGLFAAIPALLAYNRYANMVEKIISKYDIFQDEFESFLEQQES